MLLINELYDNMNIYLFQALFYDYHLKEALQSIRDYCLLGKGLFIEV